MKKSFWNSRTIGSHGLVGAQKRLEDFCFNLYFSYIFDDTVKTHQKLTKEYIEAFLNEDYVQMDKLDIEISVVEGAFEATACMLDATKDGYS